MPNHANPLRDGERRASGDNRMAMVKLLIQGQPKLAVSDIELTRRGPSYAVDSLSELQVVSPARYWFILGSDALKELDRWKAPHRLVKLCRLGVVNRDSKRAFSLPPSLPIEARDAIDIVPMDHNLASSSEIRERVLNGKSLRPYLPDSIINYIGAHGLYQL